MYRLRHFAYIDGDRSIDVFKIEPAGNLKIFGLQRHNMTQGTYFALRTDMVSPRSVAKVRIVNGQARSLDLSGPTDIDTVASDLSVTSLDQRGNFA